MDGATRSALCGPFRGSRSKEKKGRGPLEVRRPVYPAVITEKTACCLRKPMVKRPPSGEEKRSKQLVCACGRPAP